MLVLDWSQIPVGYDYAAQDFDGHVYAYQKKPFSSPSGRPWWCGQNFVYVKKLKENPFWRETVTRRPQKLSNSMS